MAILYTCPKCGQETISLKDKILASKFRTIFCPDCGARLADQPIILAVFYFLYLWDLFFFGFMAAYEQSLAYLAAMIIGWLLIEFFAYYIPLVTLRPLPPTVKND